MADINQSYKFSSPYPQPRYDYPTAHQRTPSASDLGLNRPSMSDNKSLERASSPTPSERVEMNEPFWPRRIPSWETIKQPKTLMYISIAVLLTAFTVAITIYHKQIEDWLHPAANWVQKLKFGWLIPIAILFVISFPPLFGHEIVAVLCGNVWGLWIGFGIVSAGTLLGEIGNFYAFRYVCQARGDKLERDSWIYACLARCVRRGGFKIAVMARLSAIPGHFTTAIFATCGMNIFVFILAAILSMPKQFITVYLGVLLEQSADPNRKPDSKSRAISISVSVITGLMTLGAGWYIYIKMRAERLGVVRERRERLGYKSSYANGGVVQAGFGGGKFTSEGREPLTRAVNDSSASLISNDVFNPRSSESDVHQPLTGYSRASGNFELQVPKPQRWDVYGRALPDENSAEGASQPYGNPYGVAVPMERSGSGAGRGQYDDPYAYNAYPPQPQQQLRSQSQTRDVLSPFAPGGSGPPPTVAPVPRAGYESRPLQMVSPTNELPSPQRVSARSPPPPSFHSQDPRKGNTEQPESPFEDSHAVAYIPPLDPPPRSNQIPAHVPRFQLSDGPAAGASRHEAEPTDASFYSAHSKFDSEGS